MKDTRRPMQKPMEPDRQSGQVEVETAIVLPVVTFLLLGLIQLGLLNQARIIAKYAAYRAVRIGSVRNADVDKMEKAGVAAALPILSWNNGGAEVIGRSDTAGQWMMKWPRFAANFMLDGGAMQYVDVVICGPTKGDVAAGLYNPGDQLVAHDKVEASAKGIRTKLRIRLVLNYRMFIPFANWVIHRMWRGEKFAKELHLDHRLVQTPYNHSGFVKGKTSYMRYVAAAHAGVFVIPIEAHYSMKLHSDVLYDSLPDDTPPECE